MACIGPVNFGPTRKVGTMEVEGKKRLRYILMLLWYNLQKKLAIETRKGKVMMQNYNKIKRYEYYTASSQKKSVVTCHCFEESYS